MKIAEIIKSNQAQIERKSTKQDSKLLQKNENTCEISIYSGELSIENYGKNLDKIKNSFPTLPPGFYEVFGDRIKDNGFSDERLNDAVQHVIDNCIYPTPTIAQFISFDKRIDVFTFSQMQKKTDSDSKAFERYKPVILFGMEKPLWVSIENIDMYNLKEWKP